MARLVRLDDEADARELCRRLGRLVEDPNLRGLAALAAPMSDGALHLVRESLARARVVVLAGARGTALLGDAFSLFAAGRELTEREAPEVSALGEWLSNAAAALDGRPAPLQVGGSAFDWSGPVVMGIVNVTPDSFSDGGRFLEPARAVDHALRLVAEGADLVDVGGESTRPRGRTYGDGAETVPVEEEIARVVPVVRGLRAQSEVPISIDTRKSEVAKAALDAGASMVNDVTGLLHDENIARVVAEAKVPLCLMHTPADIEGLAHETPSGDVVGDALAGLERSIAKATAAGIERPRLVVDPGIGFGKTAAGNLVLLRHLEAFVALGLPVLVGASRKSSIARAASRDTTPLPPSERVHASLAAAVMAYARGAHVLRVHDVRATVEALRVASAIRGATID